MEIEPTSARVPTKKLWNKLKSVLYMLTKGMAKTRLLLDLHMKLKNGKLTGKAVTGLLLHHHHHHAATFACRTSSNDVCMSFMSLQEHTLRTSKRKAHECVDEDEKVEEVFEVFNNGGAAGEVSPEPVVSPAREEESSQVDKAAEEFINRFYKQLKLQRIGCVESPSPEYYHVQA